ncbi:MAG: potB 3 [Marmoricola sp.]|nr:potB 3 [Marmoricola sp.]
MLPIGYLVLIPLFYVPVVLLLVKAFQPDNGGGAFSAFTSVFSEGHLLGTIRQSFEIAGLSFGLMLLLGYPLAYLVCFKMQQRFQLPTLLLLVMSGSISDIVRIFGWYSLLGREGVINSALMHLGITHAPVDGLLFSRFAVVIVLTSGWLPYVVIPIYSAMRTIEARQLEAARDLYSSPFATFKNVVLPMSTPGILGAFIIVFIPVLSDFATPQLVGGPSSLMIGNFVSDQVLQVGDLPAAAAAAALLLAMSVVLIGVAQRVTRKFHGG